jgi:catechol-2,3-dioxygenase
MNHYAMEMDDVDAIGLAGAKIVAERPDCSVAGLGRHVVGANMFWYLLDPAGGMFELYSDMDQIHDDDLWAAEQFRDDWNPFEVAAWNSSAIKADFFEPADIDAIGAAREAAGR